MKSKYLKPLNANNDTTSQLNNTQTPSLSCNCTTLFTASQQRDEARAALTFNQKQIANEELFDLFMENSLVLPLNEAFEPQIKQMFHSEKCVLWIDQPDKQFLVSPTFSLAAGYRSSIPGFICMNKNIIQVRDPSQAPGGFVSDPRIASANSPQLFFPISTRGTVRGVVQIVKRQGSGAFTEFDMQTASMIMKKFSIYGDFLFTSKSLTKMALSLYSGNEKLNPLELLQKHFHCQKAELWHFDTVRMNAQLYDPKLQEMVSTNTNCGIVTFSVTSQTIINCPDPKNDSHFVAEIDGQVDGPCLFVSMSMGKRDSWSVALRGRSKAFTTTDETQLTAILPFIVRSVAGFANSEEQLLFNAQLSELLDVATLLVASLNPSDIIKLILEQTKSLLHCEKSLFYLVENNELFSFFNPTKRIPITQGVSGEIVSSKNTINLIDPSSDKQFNIAVDSEQGYTPRSLLGAPVFSSNNNEVIAVILLLTRTDSSTFDDNDMKILGALNVFIGIALENSKLYQFSIEINSKLREFIETSLHTNQPETLKPLLQIILNNASQLIDSSYLSAFVVDNAKNDLVQFVHAGIDQDLDSTFSMQSIKQRKSMVYDKNQIAKMKKNKPVTSIESTPQTKNKISAIFTNENDEVNEKINQKIVCIPLLNKEKTIFGVVEAGFQKDVNHEKLDFLNTFAIIMQICFERINLREMTDFGYGEVSIKYWIPRKDRPLYEIPRKLCLTNEEEENILKLNFNAFNFDGIGLFKVAFKIFNYFELMEPFNITNEILFRFLSQIRSSYDKSPYHNWRHAIDVLQFVAFVINQGEFHKILKKEEILSLFVAAICYDCSKSNNPNKNKALDILYQQQSVQEVESCSMIISITSKDECNIFNKFDDDSFDKTWNNIIELIMSTNLSQIDHNFALFKELVTSGEIDLENKQEHRFYLMTNILKCAVVSIICRPIEIINPIFDIVLNEFVSETDSKSCKKPFLFCDSIRANILIFFSTLTHITSKLFCILNQLNENIDIWTKKIE